MFSVTKYSLIGFYWLLFQVMGSKQTEINNNFKNQFKTAFNATSIGVKNGLNVGSRKIPETFNRRGRVADTTGKTGLIVKGSEGGRIFVDQKDNGLYVEATKVSIRINTLISCFVFRNF